MGATDEELHELVKLAMDDRKGEAERLMADIVRRDEETFRRVVKDEVREIAKMSDRHRRRLSRLAMIAGILAGIVLSGMVMWFRLEFWGIVPTLWSGVFLNLSCAAFGAYVGWRAAK